MGKRLRKKELLQAIDREYASLEELLTKLKPRQMTQRGVTRGGWSVKDILAHLFEWQQMNLRWYEIGLRGEEQKMPAPGFTWREIPRLNAMFYRKHRRRSLNSVRYDFRISHARIVTLINMLSDSELTTIGYFNWTGPSWTLSDYFRANTAAHYLWARTRIRRWMSTQ